MIYRPNGALLHPERLRPYLQPSREELGERRYWQISDHALGSIKLLLTALAQEARRADVASSLMAKSLLVQLFVTLWRDRFASDGQQLSSRWRLAMVLRYLRQHCAEAIDLEEVAQRFSYSPRNFRQVFRDATATTYFSHTFRKQTGLSPSAYRRAAGSFCCSRATKARV